MLRKKKKRMLIMALCICALSVSFAMRVSAAEIRRQAGASVEKAVGIGYGKNYLTHFSKPNETSWYKFTTKAEQGYYYIDYKNFNIVDAVQLSVQNEKQVQIGTGDAYLSFDERFVRVLKPGTVYYIKLRNSSDRYRSTGDLRIRLRFFEDQTGDKRQEAKTLRQGETYRSRLETETDRDYYKFTAPAAGIYTFTVRHRTWGDITSYYGTLQNKKGKDIVNKQNPRRKLKKGETVYYRLYGDNHAYPSEYTIKVSREKS